MCERRHQGVRFDIVVSMAKNVRRIEDEEGEHDAGRSHHREAVLHRIVRVEGARCHFSTSWTSTPVGLLLPGTCSAQMWRMTTAAIMNGRRVVQREEAVQGRRRPPRSRHAAAAGARWPVRPPASAAEHVGDDRGAPEGHLAPGQHVAEEGRGHHQQENDDAEDPQDLARRLVRAEIQPAEDVHVNGREEHRRAHRVGRLDDAARVHVAADVLHRVEGEADLRGVVHREDDAGDDLHRQHECEDRAARPPVVEGSWASGSPSRVLW